jgi:rhodanese-related sulfurtransferase
LAAKRADYAGEVSVTEAYDRIRNTPSALLIDVRSDAEWNFVGTPDLSSLGREPLLVSWQVFPGMKLNAAFVETLKARVADRDTPLFFICRSGARSRAAAIAMTEAGYSQAFNVAGGFEGDLDTARHRGNTGGWKAAGLPWKQS